MGALVNGVWQLDEGGTSTRKDGSWERSAALLRNWLTPDGSAGPCGEDGFRAEAGRYHLYVAWNCPWAHRALIMCALKQLYGLIDISRVRPRRTDQGWVFEPGGEYQDKLFGAEALHEIYSRAAPDYSGRVTVPILFDKQTGKIVSNESADIIRMLNTGFAGLAPETPDYAPCELIGEIDRWNALIYETVNNGVYRAGFATTQEAYEEAARKLFETLDKIERQLGRTRFLCGDQVSEADWRLLPTLVRFDVAYVGAFKCNLKRLIDYDHLWGYARELYQHPGIAETVRFEIYKQGYYSPSEKRNPHGIVPKGPDIDFSLAVDRSHLA